MRRGLKKAGFWKLKVFQGPPQGGPLSPLLANSYLNDYGQEMARRGVPAVGDTDDIVGFATSPHIPSCSIAAVFLLVLAAYRHSLQHGRLTERLICACNSRKRKIRVAKVNTLCYNFDKYVLYIENARGYNRNRKQC